MGSAWKSRYAILIYSAFLFIIARQWVKALIWRIIKGSADKAFDREKEELNKKEDKSMFKKNLKKAVTLTLVASMLLTGCGNGGESGTTPTPTPTPEPEVSNWDTTYIGEDDYKAYVEHTLDLMYADIVDQLTEDQKTAITALITTGKEKIEAADTVTTVDAAYDDAYNAILAAIPLANGEKNFAAADNDERAVMLGILETYAVKKGTTGISLFESGTYVMYNPRITLGTENYITGYGFGILSEGAITADLDYETNAAWKRYYHTYESSDPGTLNALNDSGSQVSDLYSYMAAGFYTTFMNETKDGYTWVPELAKEMPVALNEDENGMATKWRFEVRTGADGLKYTTASTLDSRAAFNGREVALEDYVTPFKLLLTQSNQYFRGSELASSDTSIAGALAYYEGTENGYDEELWQNVGIKVYEEDGKNYFEVEFTTPLTAFYARYYITSSLYAPIPQDFIDLVTPQFYLGYNTDATETPVDNSLSLGAYYLEAYNADQQIVFKKNPNYVYADTKYSIEGVHIKIFTAAKDDSTAGFKEFLAEHFDGSGIPQEYLDDYRNDPRTRQTTGSTNFKLNVNATNATVWEKLFGESGSIVETAKEDYWELEPALSNSYFVKGLSYAINRLAYANARGYVPSVNFLSSAYMSDPEEGISYNTTEAHEKAVASLLEDTDGYGYSIELARDYFRIALAELEASGAYTPGTKENPTEIKIEIGWMTAAQEEAYHNELKNFLETAFNDDSVCGGVYQLNVEFWVGNEWSDVYYNKMLVGQYDIGYGSISGNTLNPLDYVGILSADMEISGNFTLNFGPDTNDPDEYPIVYKGERYSYDAFYKAANTGANVVDGKNVTSEAE